MQMPQTTGFDPSASIALVGLPGVGKSTLGVIAAGSLKMKLVETDRCFGTKTGLTPGEFLKAHGREALLAKEAEVLRLILDRHASDCIIAVATRTADIATCRRLLQRFSRRHAVIHVVRGSDQVVRHLQGHVGADEVLGMYDSWLQRHRAMTNFEFFVHESPVAQDQGRGGQMPSFLSLKDVERDFLGLLRFISGKPRRASFLARPEDTDFSRMLVLPFPTDDEPPDFGDIQGVHVVQLRISFPAVRHVDWTTLLNRISRVSAAFRFDCLHPLAFCVADAFDPDPLTRGLEDEERYFGLLAHAVSLGFDYCYVDLHAPRHSTDRFLQNTASTRIAATWHRSMAPGEPAAWWKSPECLSTYWMAADMGCAVLQMSCGPATAIQDNFDTVSAVQALNGMASATAPRLCAFNTGDDGRLSRLLNRILSPVVREADADLFRHLADQGDPELDGIITLQESQTATLCGLVVNKLRFCSFGAVISHSVGPAIHNAAFATLGLPHHYGVMESGDLDEALAFMRSRDFGGLSVANPHKQTMGRFLDVISDHARAIQAVNTVHVRRSVTEDRRLLCGENTDWMGIISTIQYSLSPINAVTSKTTALVVGGGGMARAAIYALLRLGLSRILILNRTLRKAEIIARDFSLISEQLLPHHKNTARASMTEPKACAFTVLSNADDINTKLPDITPPTIIINTLADGKDEPVSSVFDLPDAWFNRPTGGVYIEVSGALKSDPYTTK